MGGMHSVVSALESIATQHGAQFHFGEKGKVKVHAASRVETHAPPHVLLFFCCCAVC
jgi:phytoene dehydrogenase-like protein